MIKEPWPEKEARLRKLGFSDTDLAKARPRKKSKKAKAGHPSEYEEQKEFVKWIRKEHPEHKRRLLMIGNAPRTASERKKKERRVDGGEGERPPRAQAGALEKGNPPPRGGFEGGPGEKA